MLHAQLARLRSWRQLQPTDALSWRYVLQSLCVALCVCVCGCVCVC
eukprot:COSAG03_NODE_9371_length_725_cov_1.273163_2_plen_45_part_01